MSRMGYSGFSRRLSSPCLCSRGFRLMCGKRFSVKRLHTGLVSLFRALKRLRVRYGRALRVFRCRSGGRGSGKNDNSRAWLVEGDMPRSSACGLRYVVRSNTFRAEAIVDCLEFIGGDLFGCFSCSMKL